ncbi:MAG TPA: hypothetical protein VLF18_03885 [Tahibacter sp.]|uniref:hypothetical protein n=1 Tax=Tahibacter sp. TaxID=2056211 RepID=UPI002BF08818|nr:hypothetical protein [Tahibacter sp.]HSX59323.1 hypothetical protein [Tahibacter sp.]
MPSLLAILRDILLLRRGPQDLPYSPALLTMAALAGLLVSQMAGVLLLPTQQDLFVRVAAALGLGLGLLYLLLHVLQRQARFVQTATASLFVDLVFTAITLPLLPLIEPALRVAAKQNSTPDDMAAVMNGGVAAAVLLFVVIGIWRILVDVHVLRQALEIRPFAAFLIYFAMFFASNIMLGALFGVAEGT